MDKRKRPWPVEPDRPLGEKLRISATNEFLEQPKLKDALSLGAKLRRANPATANKTKFESENHQKTEIEQLDLGQILKCLGTMVKGKYVKDPMCILALRHMAKQIREDRGNEKLTVRLHLVRSGVIESNLLPLIRTSPNDEKLFELCLNIMYDLTLPPAILLRTFPKDVMEDSHVIRMHLREYDDRRQATKKLFIDPAFFTLLCEHLKRILNLEERSNEQTNFVGNSLRLLRNLFEIQGEVDRGVDRETPALVHDKVFCALDQSGITAILLWLSSSTDEGDFALDVLEVLHALLHDFDPETLGKLVRTEKDLQESNAAVAQLRKREEAAQMAAKLKAASRHASFGGSFTVKGSRAVNPDNEIVLLKPVTAILNNKFELTADKQAQAKARNKQAVKTVVERTSAPAVVSDALQTFCRRFLSNSYNIFMHNVRASVGYVPVDEADEHYSRYFWALRFFCTFARVHDVGVQFISQSVSVESFHFVHARLENYTDSVLTDKQQIPLWSNRAHIALRAYQELLLTLAGMMGSTEQSMIRAAKQIEMNLFYVPEYREVFFKLLREFHEIKYSRAYLKDLLMTIHVFLKLLEVYLQKQNHLYVMKKKRAKKVATDQIDPLMELLGDSAIPEEVDGSKKTDQVKEVEFDLLQFLKRFASPAHVGPYLLLLRDYASNSFTVNHAILKMLHRIAVDLQLPGMLFQISLFRLYHRLLKNEQVPGEPRFHEEFREFMHFILEKFFEKMREDPKMAVLSMLFWKSRNEAHELVEGPTEKPEKKAPRRGADMLTDFQREQVDASRMDAVPVRNAREESPDDGEDFTARLRSLDAAQGNNSAALPEKEPLISRKAPRKPKDMPTARQRRQIQATRESTSRQESPEVDQDVSTRLRTLHAAMQQVVSESHFRSGSVSDFRDDEDDDENTVSVVVRKKDRSKRGLDTSAANSDDEEQGPATQRKKSKNVMESDDEEDVADDSAVMTGSGLNGSNRRVALIEDDD